MRQGLADAASGVRSTALPGRGGQKAALFDHKFAWDSVFVFPYGWAPTIGNDTMNAPARLAASACPHDCPSTCALEVELKADGSVGRLRGSPDNSYTAGVICAKVARYAERIHSDRRLLKPLLRTGPKGSGAFREVGWDDVPPLDTIGMEVGYRLIALVDRNQGGQLLGRIKGVRKKLSQELGFLIPPVHIRDNLDLAPTACRLKVRIARPCCPRIRRSSQGAPSIFQP